MKTSLDARKSKASKQLDKNIPSHLKFEKNPDVQLP